MSRFGASRSAKPRPRRRTSRVLRRPSASLRPVPGTLLAKDHAGQDPTGWWMSEKMDGVRARWDGRGRLTSRNGNAFHAPKWFTESLSSTPLDGELWMGRGRFSECSGIVRRKAGDWAGVTYRVFDVPAAGRTFERRQAILKGLSLPGHARIVRQTRCSGPAHLKRELAWVTAAGGEGLMLRQPGSAYVGKRSGTLLKVKKVHDAEARVVAHEKGTGKYAAVTGALACRLPSGKAFRIGTGLSDEERRNPPKVGSTVTFGYQELTEGGVPRFPTFIRVRRDEPKRSRVRRIRKTTHGRR